MTTAFLPGLEDVPAPPGLSGRSLALWRLARHPAKRLILEALFAIAGGRDSSARRRRPRSGGASKSSVTTRRPRAMSIFTFASSIGTLA